MKFKFGKPTPREAREAADAKRIDDAAKMVEIEIIPDPAGHWGFRFTFEGQTWNNANKIYSEELAIRAATDGLREKVKEAKHKTLGPRTIEVDISKWQ